MMDPGRPDGVLTLSGPQTLSAIGAAHDAVLAALSNQQTIIIDCSAVTEADLSLVQVLLSARLSAELEGKHLSLSEPASGPLLVALTRGGFLGHGSDSFWQSAEVGA